MDEIYIYENVEVRLTGRFAKRTSDERSSRNLMSEITPVNKEEDGTWKKWVLFGTLYKVFTANPSQIQKDS
jgi:hypothetical protein